MLIAWIGLYLYATCDVTSFLPPSYQDLYIYLQWIVQPSTHICSINIYIYPDGNNPLIYIYICTYIYIKTHCINPYMNSIIMGLNQCSFFSSRCFISETWRNSSCRALEDDEVNPIIDNSI